MNTYTYKVLTVFNIRYFQIMTLLVMSFSSIIHAQKFVNQKVLEKIFEKSEIEASQFLTLEKGSISYKLFQNDLKIWKYHSLANATYSVSAADDQSVIRNYIFERAPLGCLMELVEYPRSFADKFILDKLRQLDPSIGENPYSKVSLIIDGYKSCSDNTTFCLNVSRDLHWDFYQFFAEVHDDSIYNFKFSSKDYSLPGYFQDFRDFIENNQPDIGINEVSHLDKFNQALAYHPNLHIVFHGHSSIGSDGFKTIVEERRYRCDAINDFVEFLISINNIAKLQSIYVDLNVCNGGSCRVENENRGSSLEKVLSGFSNSDFFSKVPSLSGRGNSLVCGGGAHTLVYLGQGEDNFSISAMPFDSVIGSKVNINKELNHDIKYYIVNKNGEKISDPFILQMINIRANLAVSIDKSLKDKNAHRPTKEDILQTMEHGRSDDTLLVQIAQFINLEIILRRIQDKTEQQLAYAIDDYKKGNLIEPYFNLSPQAAFDEWNSKK